MRFVGVVGLGILLGVSSFPGLAAEDWEGFRARMAAYDNTVAISGRFASLLSEGNDEGLRRLADDMRQQLGDRYLRLVYDGYGFEPEPGQSDIEHFDALVAHVAGLGGLPTLRLREMPWRTRALAKRQASS